MYLFRKIRTKKYQNHMLLSVPKFGDGSAEKATLVAKNRTFSYTFFIWRKILYSNLKYMPCILDALLLRIYNAKKI